MYKGFINLVEMIQTLLNNLKIFFSVIVENTSNLNDHLKFGVKH